MSELVKKIAVVTGAGSGIGRSTAVALAEAGYSLALAGRRLDKLEETVAAIRESDLAADCQSIAVSTDVTSAESVRKLFEEVEENFGRCDVLFNNAGISLPERETEELSLEEWQYVLNTNVTGVFLCTQAAIQLMLRQDPVGGRIINNGSISAHVPRRKSLAYTASKHAVSGITKSTNLDYRGTGICCGQIDVGNALTEMVMDADGNPREAAMHPSDVAGAVLYMANLPLDTNVPFMTIMANSMLYMGRG